MNSWLSGRTLDETLGQLIPAGGVVGPVYGAEDIVEDPHYQAREDIIEMDDPELGHTRMLGIVPKFSETPGAVEHAGPTVGQHNSAHLRLVAGTRRHRLGRLDRAGRDMTGRPRLLVATGNPGKVREYAGLLRDAPFTLLSLRDMGITHEVDETGSTFSENAWLKASQYAALSGVLTLADDSGLEVDALGGEPGVHSARYGGDACRSDTERVALLLRNLDGVSWPRRTARFRCVINIARPPSDADEPPELLASVVGSVAGMIQYETGRR